jgi:GT2 family glycosyltransferase
VAGTLETPVQSSPPGADAPEGAPDAALPPPSATPAPPAVVAVVVARDPGDWFEEAVASLADQDYPNLSILVIDANSAEPVKPRVATVAPGAFVRRLEEDPGFGAAANEVIEVVDGAAFYLLCHDDVAPAPDVIRLLVEEAFRSNAALVGPKLVDWDDPQRLLQVGQGMDHAGYGVPLVERGELDQSQHDAVRDVFTVPAPCTLVRADLFAEIGGFDEGISDFLDDVSLCWRAQVAGARVIVAPDARVRNRDELATRVGYDQRRRLQARHRLRIVLSCYRPLGVARAVAQTVVLNLAEVLYALVAGRSRRIGDVVHAWTWNLSSFSGLREARRHVRGFRRASDSDVRRNMHGGSARLSQLLRGQIGRGEDRLTGLARSGREAAGRMQTGNLRVAATVWGAVLFVLVIGSRHLLTRGVPEVGQLVSFGDSPFALLRAWASGWRIAGLGSPSPAPTGLGVIGTLGLPMLGAMGLLRTLLILGMLPLGALFAYRLPRPTGSRWAQLACLLVYVAVPLPYNALARGRWDAVVLYATAPLLLAMLARASRVVPFGSDGGEAGPGVRETPWRLRVLAVGFVTALAATVAPVAVVLLVLMGFGLAAGGVIAVSPRGGLRLLATSFVGAGLAVLLHLPWTLDFLLPGSTVESFTGGSTDPGSSNLAALLRFETGPLGGAPFGWSFLVVAALPLLIARGERHTWAVRGWTVSIASFGLAWAAQRGTFDVALPPVDVLLVPAAAGLALAAAMGVVAFEVDLPGYRFGWRQIASGLAAVAVVVCVVPVLGATFDGRWSMPSGDHSRSLGFIDDENDEESFRVLWIGDPAALPLDGWPLDEGVDYATTDDGSPTLENLWVGSDEGRTGLIGDALDLARTGQTARLGRLLAPMGVRYVVVTEQLAPAPFSDDPIPVPGGLTATLAAQLDLEPLDVPAGLTVYRNQAAIPMRSELPSSVEIPTGGGAASVLTLDLSGAAAVLPDEDGRVRWSGTLEGDSTVLLSASSSDGWELEVDGEGAERVKPFGWATGFEVEEGGEATLRFRTPLVRYGVVAIQAIAWLWVLRVLVRRRFEGPGSAPAARPAAAHVPAHIAVGAVEETPPPTLEASGVVEADPPGPDNARSGDGQSVVADEEEVES